MVERRTLLVACLALTAIASATLAQEPVRLPRIAYVSNSTPEDQRIQILRDALRDYGYVEGDTIEIDYHYYQSADELPQLAAAVVASEPDIIVSLFTPTALALKAATDTIPIVICAVTDPVASGIVDSLNRPGGNITGVTLNAGDVSGKKLEYLKMLIPALTRVAVLYNPNNPAAELQLSEIRVAGTALGVELLPVEAQGTDDWDAILGRLEAEDVQAAYFTHDQTYQNYLKPITEALQRHPVPSMHGFRELVEAGALISYGVELPAHLARPAYYIDRILNGALPADLPLEQPRELELVINKRAADAMRLTIPRELLLLANAIIE